MTFRELSKLSAAETEANISQYWDEQDILNKTIENRKDASNFVFFEGPPTANGRPGIHHVIARTLKDSVNKYQTMKGHRVVRKAGWDTHGLPVEIEVEKSLKMNGKQDIEKYGIKEFNEKCRESVFSYEAQWREMTRRMGYFIDLEHPYITLDNNYVESVWWILNQFYKAGLIYEGHKILPYCPRCGTGLASHEVAQGYQMITVDTVIVKMKKEGADNEYFLAWTTTPWTLASNTALCVNPNVTYAKVKKDDSIYYLAEALVPSVLGDDCTILETMNGRELEYMRYEQLMPFVKVPKEQAFFVTCGDFVTTEDGTGIVHMAPAFGEDDYNMGLKYHLPVVNPVDETGKYTETPWAGQFVMDADPEIVRWLKENGKLFKKQRMEHNYPHCWRCKTPLLYYAKPSWYIRVTDYKDKLIEANNSVTWYPDFVGEKRFGNWLENLKDWAISRNRYWGTPLNIWRCDCGHTESIGSRAELCERAIEDIDENIELHRPYVDEVHITCPVCGKPMSRVKDVIDCWFDSGSMPFAQYHYPFENKEIFEDQFPADFICEGIDQTRGWFYSLLAISVFLTGKSPYKRVLVNDLILDKDGLKMSKSRGNTVNPFDMFDKYGADALRWYLLYVSPAWTPTKFDEDGLSEVISKYFNTLRNVYSFFAMYANADDIDPTKFDIPVAERDEMDRWLLSRYNSVLKEVTESAERYDLTKVTRAITQFVNDDISNWYIRRSRRRFWESELTKSKQSVYRTTYEVLLGVAEMSAPFAPYISEELYRCLTELPSVHLADYPSCREELIDLSLEQKMNVIRDLVSLGRSAREEAGIKVRQPLSEVIIDAANEAKIGSGTELITEELNVKRVRYEENLGEFINYTLKPDFKVCGKLFGKNVKALAAYLADANGAELIRALKSGSVEIPINGETLEITSEMLDIRVSAKEGYDVQTDGEQFILLNTALSDELINEGCAREIISKVQQFRKNSGFEVTDRIRLYISSDDAVASALDMFGDYIRGEVLADEILPADTGISVSLNGREAVIRVERV